MNLAEAILAAMLALQPVGRSVYSAIPEVEGVVCDTSLTHGCRLETADEGTVRYWTIAQAIAARGENADDTIAAQLITVTYHESGWRRDVHAGVGKWSRGDQGRSWCLGQVLLGRSLKAKAPLGLTAGELVGIDADATQRCVSVVDHYLEFASQRCARLGRPDAGCWFATYGGVANARDKRIQARVRTYRRVRALMAEPKPLPPETRELLGLPPEDGA